MELDVFRPGSHRSRIYTEPIPGPMNTIRRRLPSLVIALLVTGCGGTAVTPATGTVSGTVSSSLGPITGATVVVTPSGAAALPATTTSASGGYSVASVPVGGGTVTVSNVPSGCTAPAPVSYSGVAAAATLTVNVPVACVGTGTLTGTISSSLGGTLAGVTVTVTPQGHSALAGVITNSSGVYTVTLVPAGSGSISVSNVGSSCTAPAPTAYTGLTTGGTVTTNFTLTCTPASPPPATTLSVGQSAVFTDSAHMNTALTLQTGAEYLIAVVNTDSSSSLLEDFTLHGATTVSGSVVAHAAPHGARPSRAVTPKIPMRPISPEIARAVAVRARTERAHMAWLDRWPAMAAQARSGTPTVIRKSLVGTTVGQVNRVWVANFSGSGCNSVDTVWARTVYVGTHVLVLADTNTTTWPLANRPDTSFYAQFGSEWDAITYPHLQNYFG